MLMSSARRADRNGRVPVNCLMTVQQLFQSGQLDEALKGLTAEVRDNPTDPKRRTFLFELLCFAGEYARAEKQLDVLSQGGPQSEMGALFYRGALAAEKTRQDMFEKQDYPKPVVISGFHFPFYLRSISSLQKGCVICFGSPPRCAHRRHFKGGNWAKCFFLFSTPSPGEARILRSDWAGLRLGKRKEAKKRYPRGRNCSSRTTRNGRSWNCATLSLWLRRRPLKLRPCPYLKAY